MEKGASSKLPRRIRRQGRPISPADHRRVVAATAADKTPFARTADTNHEITTADLGPAR